MIFSSGPVDSMMPKGKRGRIRTSYVYNVIYRRRNREQARSDKHTVVPHPGDVPINA